MQFTNLAFVLQVAAIAAAAAIPLNGASDALLDKREPKVEVDVQQSTYCIPGTFGCHSRRSESVTKREPKVEVDVQQSNYCIPGTFGCRSRRTDTQAVQE